MAQPLTNSYARDHSMIIDTGISRELDGMLVRISRIDERHQIVHHSIFIQKARETSGCRTHTHYVAVYVDAFSRAIKKSRFGQVTQIYRLPLAIEESLHCIR